MKLQKVLVCFLLLQLYVALNSSLCLSKSFTIPESNIQCTIFQNGNVSWNEIKTISFQGYYHYGIITLPTYNYDYLRNIRVDEISFFDQLIPYQDNLSRNLYTFWIERTDYLNWLHFYFSAENTQKRFRFSYIIDGSIDLYEDYGQFIWILDEGRFAAPIEHLFATFHLEKRIPKEELNFWVHGPDQYRLTYVDEKTITLSIDHIPLNTEIEVRLLLPRSYFTMEPNGIGEIRDTAIRDEAFREKSIYENKLAEAKAKKEKGFTQLYTGIILVFIAMLLFGYLLYTLLRFGLGYSLSKNAETITEPDDNLSPGEVSYLMGFNRFTVRAIQSTLLDFIRKKYLLVERVDGADKRLFKYVFFQNPEIPDDALLEHEQILLREILFPQNGSFNSSRMSIDQLKKQIRENINSNNLINRLKNTLKKRLIAEKYLDLLNQKIAENVMIACIALIAGFVYYYLLIPRQFLILVPLIGLILLFYGNMSVYRRTPKGKSVTQRYLSHRKFLGSFSQLDLVDNYDADLWEQYFIFSVILESMKKFMILLRSKFKPIQEEESMLLNTATSKDLLKITYSLGSFINEFSLVNSWVFCILKKKHENVASDLTMEKETEVSRLNEEKRGDIDE